MGKIATWETEFIESEQRMVHRFTNGLKMVVDFRIGRYWLANQDGCMLESGPLNIKVKEWKEYLTAISKR